MSHPQITLPLLWQAVQDLKHEPNRQGQPLGLLIPEALNELELCAYHLNPAPSISKEEFTALQVGEHVYAQLSSPITKAYASRKLVPFGRAAISITRNRNKALAVERLSEFIRLWPTLDTRLFPLGTNPAELLKYWTTQGIPEPLIELIKPEYADYWKAVISNSARERGRKKTKKSFGAS